MQALTAFTLALALAFSMPYGMAASDTKINVVTTTTDLKSLVTSVGGDRVTVESIAAPDQDPHSMELKPIQLVRLRDADLVVRIGMDHEPWLARMSTNAQVLNTSNNVQLIQTETPRLRAERRAHVHRHGLDLGRSLRAELVEEAVERLGVLARMSQVPWNFGGGPVTIRRLRLHHRIAV